MHALGFGIHNGVCIITEVLLRDWDLDFIIRLSSEIIFLALDILSRYDDAVSWHFISKLELN